MWCERSTAWHDNFLIQCVDMFIFTSTSMTHYNLFHHWIYSATRQTLHPNSLNNPHSFALMVTMGIFSAIFVLFLAENLIFKIINMEISITVLVLKGGGGDHHQKCYGLRADDVVSGACKYIICMCYHATDWDVCVCAGKRLNAIHARIVCKMNTQYECSVLRHASPEN